MIEGIDGLGAAHKLFDLSTLLELLPNDSALGVFLDEFGNVLPKLCDQKPRHLAKLKAIRFQAWWQSPQHYIVPLDVLRKRAPAVERFAKDFPKIQIYLSHSCEHVEKSRAEVLKRINIIEKLAPSCIPVNCPWTGAVLKHHLNEFHNVFHAHDGDYIHSTDGVSLYDQDAQLWNQTHKNAIIKFAWGARENLREVSHAGDSPPLEPNDRTAAPSREYQQSLIRLLGVKGKKPKVKFQYEPFIEPMLYKTHSEDFAGIEDARENRPLVALPAAGNTIDVIDSKEHVLGKFVLVKGKLRNMNRFYSVGPGAIGLWGFQIEQRAKELSGSGFVSFRDESGKCYGLLNPSFREGYYHDDD